MVNMQLQDFSNFVMDVRTALMVKELTDIMPQIVEVRKIQGRLEAVQKNQAVLAQVMEVIQKQLAEKQAALEAVQQLERVVIDRGSRFAWALAR